MRRALAGLVVALLFAACGGSDTIDVNRGLEVQTPGANAIVSTHTAGPLEVTVRRPGDTDRGLVRIELTVLDAGTGIDGLQIVALSDMPTMNHPTELQPLGDGAGRYKLDVPLGMPGVWEIEFTISGEAYGELDPFTIDFDVNAPDA